VYFPPVLAICHPALFNIGNMTYIKMRHLNVAARFLLRYTQGNSFIFEVIETFREKRAFLQKISPPCPSDIPPNAKSMDFWGKQPSPKSESFIVVFWGGWEGAGI
jgi:hypothetical protein